MSDRGRNDDDFAPKIVYRRKPGTGDAGSGAAGPVPGAPSGPWSSRPEPDRPASPPPRQATSPPPPLPGSAHRPAAPPAQRASPSLLRDEVAGPARRPPERSRDEATGGRRGLGVWVLAVLNFAIAAGLLAWVAALITSRGWELEKSFDVDEELQAALTGLDIMIRAATVAAVGFVVSAAGLLTARKIGWTIAVAWAALATVTGIGAVYGLPALVWLFAPSTRSRFGFI